MSGVGYVMSIGVCKSHRAQKPLINAVMKDVHTNHVSKGGVCIRQGAIIKRCRDEGCTNNERVGDMEKACNISTQVTSSIFIQHLFGQFQPHLRPHVGSNLQIYVKSLNPALDSDI